MQPDCGQLMELGRAGKGGLSGREAFIRFDNYRFFYDGICFFGPMRDARDGDRKVWSSSAAQAVDSRMSQLVDAHSCRILPMQFHGEMLRSSSCGTRKPGLRID